MPSCCKALYLLMCCCAVGPLQDDLLSSQDRAVQSDVVSEVEQKNPRPLTAYQIKTTVESTLVIQRESCKRINAWMSEIEQAHRKDLCPNLNKLESEI